MGEEVNATASTGGDGVPPAQPGVQTPEAAEDTTALTPAEQAAAEEWYKDNGGSVYHSSTMVNPEGLKLACYRWDPQPQGKDGVRGKIVLIHGYAMHARFEYLRQELDDAEGPPHYDKSWIQRFSLAGFSVHAVDLQSFGASEGLKGKRAHIHDFDALPRDIIQFLHEQVLPAYDNPSAPIFLLGISMGGCAVTRAVELLAGGHYRNKCCCQGKCRYCPHVLAVADDSGESPAAGGDAGSGAADEADKEKNEKSPEADGKQAAGGECPEQNEKDGQQPRPRKKVLLPLKGLICLAPMYALERMKKKNKLVLPFAKLLATLSPTLEIAKAARNPAYPAFQTLMKHDPLAYNGKTRARLSYEFLYAVSAVQQQAHFLATPAAEALTPQSPQPFPVYIDAVPSMLIVESKNDTFVDPEGSVYVAAVVDAKMEGSPETLAKYQPYYDTVKASVKTTSLTEATLWMLDDMWHCITKELPESDVLLDRIINSWLLPHAAAAAAGGSSPPPPVSDKREATADSAAKAAEGGQTAADAADSQGSPRSDKHKKHKKGKGGAGAEEAAVPIDGEAAEAAPAAAAGAAAAAAGANELEQKQPLTPAHSDASDKKAEVDAAAAAKEKEGEEEKDAAKQEPPAADATAAPATAAAAESATAAADAPAAAAAAEAETPSAAADAPAAAPEASAPATDSSAAEKMTEGQQEAPAASPAPASPTAAGGGGGADAAGKEEGQAAAAAAGDDDKPKAADEQQPPAAQEQPAAGDQPKTEEQQEQQQQQQEAPKPEGETAAAAAAEKEGGGAAAAPEKEEVQQQQTEKAEAEGSPEEQKTDDNPEQQQQSAPPAADADKSDAAATGEANAAGDSQE